MFIFLIVILALGAVLEGLSIRGGTERIGLDLTLTETRTEPGEPFSVVTTVENGGRLPITYLCVTTTQSLYAQLPASAQTTKRRNDVTVEDVYRLWGRQRVTRTMPVQIEKRGVHNVGTLTVKRGDFLGVRITTTPVSIFRKIIVYPRALENADLNDALGSYCGDLIAQRWLIRDPILTLGVREYTGNEPMNTISWSQTARRGELTVREFDYTRSLSCCVIFCTNGASAAEPELLDVCCSAVRTVCETLIAHGVEPALYSNAMLVGYYDGRIRKYSASAGRMQDVLEALARTTPVAVCPVSNLVGECLREQTDTAAYLLVAPNRDAETEAAAEVLRSRTGAGVMLLTGEELGGGV